MASVNGRLGAKCLKAPQFFRLCEWMKKQPQPIIMTRPAMAAAAEADMGLPISTSTIASAIEATGVEVKTPGREAPVPKAHDSRLRIMASILIRVTDHMAMLGRSTTDQSSFFLRRGCRRCETALWSNTRSTHDHEEHSHAGLAGSRRPAL